MTALSQILSSRRAAIDAADVSGLGTAATTAATDYATAAQGATADTAYQSSDLASQAQAETGSNNTTLMTPFRTAEAIAVNLAGFDVFTDVFSTSGTWTKRDNAALVFVELLGAGEGGEAARGQTASSFTIAYPGNGGKGGAYVEALFPAEALPSTVTVSVGAGGLGQNVTSITISNSLPAWDPSGGITTFGSFLSSDRIEGNAVAAGETSVLGASGRYGSSSSYRNDSSDAPDCGRAGGSGGNGGAGYSWSGSQGRTNGYNGGLTLGVMSGVSTTGSGGVGGSGAASVSGANGVALGEGGGGGSVSTGYPSFGGQGGNGGLGAGGGGAGALGTPAEGGSGSYYGGRGGDGGDGWMRVTTLVMRSTQT